MVENEAVNAENAAEEKQTENTDIGTEGDADANGGEKPAQDNAGGNTSAGYPDEVGGLRQGCAGRTKTTLTA